MDIRSLSTKGYNLWGETCTDTGIGSGIIEIEPGFQIVSIPITYGYWSVSSHTHVHDGTTPATIYNYVTTQIEDTYGVQARTMVEFFNTLIGGQGYYFTFFPNQTNPLGEYNFELSYLDSGTGYEEITGFYVNSIHHTTFTIQWGDI